MQKAKTRKLVGIMRMTRMLRCRSDLSSSSSSSEEGVVLRIRTTQILSSRNKKKKSNAVVWRISFVDSGFSSRVKVESSRIATTAFSPVVCLVGSCCVPFFSSLLSCDLIRWCFKNNRQVARIRPLFILESEKKKKKSDNKIISAFIYF